jgi:hypothetical protein
MQSQDQSQLPRPISRIFFQGCSKDKWSCFPECRSRKAVLSDELLQRALKVAKAVNGRLEIRVSRALPPLPREASLKLPQKLRNKITSPARDDGVNVTHL